MECAKRPVRHPAQWIQKARVKLPAGMFSETNGIHDGEADPVYVSEGNFKDIVSTDGDGTYNLSAPLNG